MDNFSFSNFCDTKKKPWHEHPSFSWFFQIYREDFHCRGHGLCRLSMPRCASSKSQISFQIGHRKQRLLSPFKLFAFQQGNAKKSRSDPEGFYRHINFSGFFFFAIAFVYVVGKHSCTKCTRTRHISCSVWLQPPNGQFHWIIVHWITQLLSLVFGRREKKTQWSFLLNPQFFFSSIFFCSLCARCRFRDVHWVCGRHVHRSFSAFAFVFNFSEH